LEKKNCGYSQFFVACNQFIEMFIHQLRLANHPLARPFTRRSHTATLATPPFASHNDPLETAASRTELPLERPLIITITPNQPQLGGPSSDTEFVIRTESGIPIEIRNRIEEPTHPLTHLLTATPPTNRNRKRFRAKLNETLIRRKRAH